LAFTSTEFLMPDPVEYRSPDTESPHPKRTLATWCLLLLVWTVGVIVWGIYITLGVVLLARFL
jgi:hypothetical protein